MVYEEAFKDNASCYKNDILLNGIYTINDSNIIPGMKIRGYMYSTEGGGKSACDQVCSSPELIAFHSTIRVSFDNIFEEIFFSSGNEQTNMDVSSMLP